MATSKQREFFNGEIYHIVLRSVEGIKIFKDDSDYYRAIFGLYEFNNDHPVNIWKNRKKRKAKQQVVLGSTSPNLISKNLFSLKRDRIVELLAFCLMPHHIHLLLRQIKDQGITKFMRKCGTGYAMYFNKKYDRKGHLFQSNFVSVHIKNEAQLSVVFNYIHLNPVSIIFPHYKEKGIADVEKAMSFLESYKWSSLLDYLGQKNFPSVTQRDFMLEVISDPKLVREEILSWLKQKKEVKETEVLLE